MNADAEFDPALARQTGVALGHAVLNLDRALHGVDHAAEFDETAVAGSLDDAPMMGVDRGVDQIAAQASEPRQRAILVRAGAAALTGARRSVAEEAPPETTSLRLPKTSGFTCLAPLQLLDDLLREEGFVNIR
jgi:hypothetical protein